MNLDDLFAALDLRGLDPKSKGTGLISRCPAHDDANPSFGADVGADGRILAKCLAGCSFAAIATALGTEQREWFPPREQPVKPLHRGSGDLRYVCEWAIRDVAGNVVAIHKRFAKPDGGKSVIWYDATGSLSKKGTASHVETRTLPLYGVHDLPPTGPVVVTEGEKDADALRSRGIVAVGTVTGASGLPCDASLEPLKGRDVILWPDNDDPGRKHMERLARRIKPASLKIVGWPSAPDGGGAADAGDDAHLILAAALPWLPDTPPDAGPDEPHTDLGVARRFIAKHGDDFRFDGSTWYRWDGRRWARDTAGLVTHTIAAVARSVSVAAGGDEITAKAARKQESSSRVNGATSLASVDPRVYSDAFDAHPHLLTCRNAVVDLRTGVGLPPRKGDHLSRSVPHDFDPSSRCPRWESFLSEVCANRDDLVGFVRRFAGYCLTGETREHALMLAIGQGRNGKSVFVETLMYVLGSEFAQPAAPALLLASKSERHPAELMDLRGLRLVVASEVPKHGAFSEERVKWLTGGDSIKAREFYGKFQTFAPSHKFLLCANHLPTVKDPTDGFWRRVRVVPFDVSFKGREEKGLTERLRSEAPGILAWLVRASVEWRTLGLPEVAAVSSATEDYRDSEDLLGRFLAQFRPGEERPLKAIHEAFKAWAAAEGEAEPRGGKHLAADLTSAGWKRHKKTSGALWSAPQSEVVPEITPDLYPDPGYIPDPSDYDA